MLIADVLKNKANGVDVETIEPAATVEDLLTRMADSEIGALVVSSDGRTPAGIVSERDVVREIRHRGPEVLSQAVQSVMIPLADMITTSGTGTVEYVMRLMTEARVRHVPVLLDGFLAGLVSIGDLVKSRTDELESERNRLIEYVASGF